MSISAVFRHDGWVKEALDVFPKMTAETFKGSPIETEYRKLSPTPDEFPNSIVPSYSHYNLISSPEVPQIVGKYLADPLTDPPSGAAAASQRRMAESKIRFRATLFRPATTATRAPCRVLGGGTWWANDLLRPVW